MRYWLMKSEPDVYSIDDLAAEPDATSPWEGVRNYQARNFMRAMRVGDLALFYHSNCKTPGVVGVMKVARESYPDETAFDPKSPYHDPKSRLDAPRWDRVDVQYIRHLSRIVSLAEIRQCPELADLPLVRRGNRLSVMPVTSQQWQAILTLEQHR